MNKTSFLPGLAINLTDQCNFRCQYCPPFGENLNASSIQYDEDAIIAAIQLAKKHKLPMVRMTGGEPFLEPGRLCRFLEACGKSFERIVINTNGSLLGDHLEQLEKYKQNIILKISLDSFDPDEFRDMSHSHDYQKVIDNTLDAISKGFIVEINCVIYHQSFSSLKKVLEFAINNQIDCKFLTVSSFHGMVKEQTSKDAVRELVKYLVDNSEQSGEEKLQGQRGGTMLRFRIGKSKILLFDHSLENSVTPTRSYFDFCSTSCPMYPCESGALSISIFTDGVMSCCRGRKDLGYQVFYRTMNEIEEAFEKQVSLFKNCFSININQKS